MKINFRNVFKNIYFLILALFIKMSMEFTTDIEMSKIWN